MHVHAHAYMFLHKCVCLYMFLSGNLVWKFEVSEAIIPDGCSYKIEDYKIIVTLQKQKPGPWNKFHAFKVRA